ncbi:MULTISPECIES: hypothetical protein [unclassified Streptomyces]|uniref:hypothetical protein n=1 Tax=unclassified Streptomyces TaxID=2593676 RepID=UPI000DC7AA43|nr:MULTISPECIES: hypothetical protein [unclassified Streptomyces]AWZ09692.1 hypothetical protein DRB89_40640 [Streptomyces sp. ICC4]AWZ17429.1 hypothetical protein DRB96_40970 [Streptomyces sp. ICC1]
MRMRKALAVVIAAGLAVAAVVAAGGGAADGDGQGLAGVTPYANYGPPAGADGGTAHVEDFTPNRTT